MLRSNIVKLILSLIIPLSVGAVAGMFTSQAVPTWYASLNRPSFSPPNWVFGPVWTSLYILLGISFFLIWKESPSQQRNRAIIVFASQMLLNFAWSFIFFYFNMIGIALLEIILLWVNIAVMISLFYKLKPLAAYLNIPYLLWVSFATILNAGYYFLN
ncbi:MAG TPA: tryptophan-rich sensory protein [Melioribacteraceae bacterium]|nr:tryptophan-rich sensory protein [Melioribacteraceae bacterium]